MCTCQNLAGQGPGFDSKYEQLTPRQPKLGPVVTPWMVRSPEVPDTLSLTRLLITGVPGLKRFLKNAPPPT